MNKETKRKTRKKKRKKKKKRTKRKIEKLDLISKQSIGAISNNEEELECKN